MIDEINKQIQAKLNEVQNKIVQTVDDNYSKELTELGIGIFMSPEVRGEVGRYWKPLANSTSRRRINKGSTDLNIDTGQLFDAISSPDFLLDDDYMDNLPEAPKKGNQNRDYKKASDLRDFSNIGRTEQEQERIIEALIKDIEDAFK